MYVLVELLLVHLQPLGCDVLNEVYCPTLHDREESLRIHKATPKLKAHTQLSFKYSRAESLARDGEVGKGETTWQGTGMRHTDLVAVHIPGKVSCQNVPSKCFLSFCYDLQLKWAYQISEVVAGFSIHQSHGITETRDIARDGKDEEEGRRGGREERRKGGEEEGGEEEGRRGGREERRKGGEEEGRRGGREERRKGGEEERRKGRRGEEEGRRGGEEEGRRGGREERRKGGEEEGRRGGREERRKGEEEEERRGGREERRKGGTGKEGGKGKVRE